MFKMINFLICTLLASFSFSNWAVEQISGINRLTFFNEANNKDFVGNGFLVRYQGKTYGVTVKHTLLEAKTNQMQTVDISNHIRQWQIHPNGKPEQAITLGKLINSDTTEAIDINILSKDWLIFEVNYNPSALKVLEIRRTPLQKDEPVTAYGCSYVNKTTCIQDAYPGLFIHYESNNLRVKMDTLELNKLRGLSGSPVLDKQGKLVGIVSNVLPALSGQGFDFAPASLDYLLQVLDKTSE